jgi:hypothetical protein
LKGERFDCSFHSIHSTVSRLARLGNRLGTSEEIAVLGPGSGQQSLIVLWATILISIAIGVYIGMQRSGQMLANSSAIASVGLILIILGLKLR